MVPAPSAALTINVIPVLPVSSQGELRSSYGAEGTYDTSLLLQAKRGPWGVLGAGGLIGTDGYIQEAPSQRGLLTLQAMSTARTLVLAGDHGTAFCARQRL